MAIISVLNDQLVGNIFHGRIIVCRFASRFTTPCGPIAFVGDTVIATGKVGSSVQTHRGQIISGLNQYIAPDGSPVAVVGISRFVAGPFRGTILGPGCPGYEAL